ncbi:MAG: hypothetical protein HeimAB125_07150 [Candidatus Heimdallarchaeota archaeon AB_125]|nr:MAG: hypothetical protein HeimAB125_07150 [Candidatus Heimdallarchaeota archaeon AB_125]
MKCPYCGYTKVVNKEGKMRVFTCPRCDYLFEESASKVILEKILSVPFCSIFYTPILLVISYYLSKLIYQESSLLSFGALLMFIILLTAFILLFIFYITSGRSSRVFIVKPTSDRSLFNILMASNSLLKIALFLIVSSIFAGIYF